MEKDQNLAINEDVLEVLYILHEMNRDYQTAFHIMVKMHNKKLFEFLNKFKIEFDLKNDAAESIYTFARDKKSPKNLIHQ